MIWRKSSFSDTTNCVEVGWRKSSYSSTTDCVEVDNRENYVFVRDSKDPDGPELAFTRSEWEAFIQGVKAGEFD